MHVSTIGAIKAAFDGAEKTDVVAFIELVCSFSRSAANNRSGGFVANGNGVLPETGACLSLERGNRDRQQRYIHEALIVGLEQHDVGVAEGSILYFDEQFMFAGLWYGNLIEVKSVVARIVSGICSTKWCCALSMVDILLRKHRSGAHSGNQDVDDLEIDRIGGCVWCLAAVLYRHALPAIGSSGGKAQPRAMRPWGRWFPTTAPRVGRP